jgi:hypothetical protein
MGIALAGAAVAGALLLLWRREALPTAHSLLMRLPAGEGPTLYVDVAALRRSGLLNRLAGSPDSEEPDYRHFVEATGFDYRRDLDVVLIAFRAEANYFLLSGRFAHDKLARFASSSGGSCRNGMCSLTGSAADRLISFQPLDDRTLGLAVSAQNPQAAALLAQRRPEIAGFTLPAGPAWLWLPGSGLKPRLGLPPRANAALSVLSEARQAVITISESSGSLRLDLDALCATPEAAVRIAALLQGGSFAADHSSVRGYWPLPPHWIESLRAGAP